MIYSLPPKVGDTLTATVVDGDGDEVDVEYAWYIDDEFYADSESITVPAGTEAGTEITLTVTDAAGNTATDTAVVIDALELLSADQTGAKTVELTFNADIDDDDKITVQKGSKEVTIDDTTYGEKSAVIALTDKIVAGATYTVTLTPANGDPATSVEFVGEKAALEEIVFLSDVLVMKDSKYSKGFAYVKGYDQYGDEINLSGLTVTPGVGKFESYDPETGKITIDSGVADGQTSPFMTIKEVPVFVQYQQDTTVLSAQANLTVSNQAYLSSMEFGEIGKDGDKRADGRLTITELASNKYYVEILNAKDQYGNALSDDDLNNQKNGASKTLFVIPSDSGAFYKTGDFATLNGQTILWLLPTGDAVPKPGTMALTITGAGGTTFTTDVTVEDDPFIQTLNVTYPALYANVAASDELEFSAVDQYGDPVDLWNFRPETNVAKTAIVFNDLNHMTNRRTTITLSANGKSWFNDVKFDAAKKDFDVTINTGLADKTDIISLVTTTAGMVVSTASLTVGAEGTAAKIKSAISGDRQLVASAFGTNDKFNFNGKIKFEDANGNEMKRDDANYPQYSDLSPAALPNTTKADGTATANHLLLTAPDNFTPAGYYWSLATDKLDADGSLVQAGANGIWTYANMGASDTKDIYAILWAENAGGTKAVVLDQQVFHFTKATGTEISYSASCGDTLYVKKSDSYTDSVDVKVTATTDQGSTYQIADSRVSLGGLPFATSGKTVQGNYDLDEVGSKTGTVYVDGKQKTSITINYTNAAPVPTKVDYSAKATTGGSRVASLYGDKISVSVSDTLEAIAGAAITVKGGVLTLTNANSFGDDVTAKIVDQYGQAVTDTVFKADGVEITNGMKVVDSTDLEPTSIEYASKGVSGKFFVSATTDIFATVPVSNTVSTESGLRAALIGSASTITINEPITLTGTPLTIPANKTLVIPTGVTFNDGNQKLTLGDGAKLNVNGSLITSNDVTLGKKAVVTVSGNWDKTAGNVTGTLNDDTTIGSEITGSGHVNFTAGTAQNLKFTVTGTTAVFSGVTFQGKNTLANHVKLIGNIAWGSNTTELQNGLTLDMSSVTTQTGTVGVAAGAKIDVVTDQGTTKEISNDGTADIGVTINTNGSTSGGSHTGASDSSTQGKLAVAGGQYASQSALQTTFDAVLTNGPTIKDAGTNGFYATFDGFVDQSTKYYYVVQVQDSTSNGLYCEYGQIIYGKYASKITEGKYAHALYHTATMNGDYSTGVQSGNKVIYSICTQAPTLSAGNFANGAYTGSATVTLNGTVLGTTTITAS